MSALLNVTNLVVEYHGTRSCAPSTTSRCRSHPARFSPSSARADAASPAWPAPSSAWRSRAPAASATGGTRCRCSACAAGQAVHLDPDGVPGPQLLVEPARARRRSRSARASRRRSPAARPARCRRNGWSASACRPRWSRATPHELSGGQRQRVAIARALAARPDLLVADEPISALDASSQASVADMMRRLALDAGAGLLFISHDLAIVRLIADRTVVMYRGEIVESGVSDRIWDEPVHPYTQALLAAIPEPDGQGHAARRTGRRGAAVVAHAGADRARPGLSRRKAQEQSSGEAVGGSPTLCSCFFACMRAADAGATVFADPLRASRASLLLRRCAARSSQRAFTWARAACLFTWACQVPASAEASCPFTLARGSSRGTRPPPKP